MLFRDLTQEQRYQHESVVKMLGKFTRQLDRFQDDTSQALKKIKNDQILIKEVIEQTQNEKKKKAEKNQIRETMQNKLKLNIGDTETPMNYLRTHKKDLSLS